MIDSRCLSRADHTIAVGGLDDRAPRETIIYRQRPIMVYLNSSRGRGGMVDTGASKTPALRITVRVRAPAPNLARIA